MLQQQINNAQLQNLAAVQQVKVCVCHSELCLNTVCVEYCAFHTKNENRNNNCKYIILKIVQTQVDGGVHTTTITTATLANGSYERY